MDAVVGDGARRAEKSWSVSLHSLWRYPVPGSRTLPKRSPIPACRLHVATRHSSSWTGHGRPCLAPPHRAGPSFTRVAHRATANLRVALTKCRPWTAGRSPRFAVPRPLLVHGASRDLLGEGRRSFSARLQGDLDVLVLASALASVLHPTWWHLSPPSVVIEALLPGLPSVETVAGADGSATDRCHLNASRTPARRLASWTSSTIRRAGLSSGTTKARVAPTVLRHSHDARTGHGGRHCRRRRPRSRLTRYRSDVRTTRDDSRNRSARRCRGRPDRDDMDAVTCSMFSFMRSALPARSRESARSMTTVVPSSFGSPSDSSSATSSAVARGHDRAATVRLPPIPGIRDLDPNRSPLERCGYLDESRRRSGPARARSRSRLLPRSQEEIPTIGSAIAPRSSHVPNKSS